MTGERNEMWTGAVRGIEGSARHQKWGSGYQFFGPARSPQGALEESHLLLSMALLALV